ncbi:related to Serine/threonine-protein phosphatase 2A activator 1 [Saccharomycodes ludwigii]|uniref:Serine/threonine-protein phosphatase 2A activator n=1 Tax=Saccharomycodes ludwigii TaxID=36035 RepID=A0A376B9T9_9ASCO|nr:related to Serine/threonine-protein phosphatase 2A activator 1 [Saccharomycodes ludwigii]
MNHTQEQKNNNDAIISTATQFSEPVKKIFDQQTTQYFQHSVAIKRLQQYIDKYVELVRGVDFDYQHIEHLVTYDPLETYIFNPLNKLIDETPPIKGPRRFGNLACRDWHDKINKDITCLLRKMLPENFHNAIIELDYYLKNSFGSKERLDYGTGHELSFLAFISGLDMLGVLVPTSSDQPLTGQDILYMFTRYYQLVQRLILTYNLEPAGSHGVWGLDDHFHISYILGASQFVGNYNALSNGITPRSILDIALVRNSTLKYKNLYFAGIAFIDEVKSGPFEEHSPILYDICKNVGSWEKVLRGLMKMYMVEVLTKFPVVQHFWFGTGFFPWVDYRNGKSLPNVEYDGDSVTVDSTANDKNIYNNSNPMTTAVFPSLDSQQYHQHSRIGETELASKYNRLLSSPTNKSNTLNYTSMPPPSISKITRVTSPGHSTSIANVDRFGRNTVPKK